MLLFTPLAGIMAPMNIIGLCLFLTLFNYQSQFTSNNRPNLLIGGENFSIVIVSLIILISVLILMVRIKYTWLNYHRVPFTSVVNVLCLIIILFFITNNILILYIIFELSLIPTLILIIKWGYQPERLQATFYFILYTISASLPLLFSILILYNSNISLVIRNLHPIAALSEGATSFILTIALLTAFLVKLPT